MQVSGFLGLFSRLSTVGLAVPAPGEQMIEASGNHQVLGGFSHLKERVF